MFRSDRRTQALLWVGLIVSITGSPALAQNFERYKPQPLPVSPPSSPDVERPLEPVGGSDRILLDKLEAVVVRDHVSSVEAEGCHPDAVGLIREYANTRSLVYSSEFTGIVSRYLDQPVSLHTLNQMSRDIILLYRRHKQPVVDVLIPEQKITNGTVQIVVIEGRIGQVRVQEGRFFSADETARWIEDTRAGGAIYEPWLEEDLFWLNQNPFRRVGVDLKPGGADGLTDVLFTVDDVFPVRAYLGYDDTGVRALGLERLSTGLTVGNLFGHGDIASYQYTTDSEFRRLHAHAATYTIPINRDFDFMTYGSWAGVVPSVPNGFSQNGESWITGFSLIRTLEKDRYVDKNIAAGFDFKSTNNDLEFGGDDVFAGTADLVTIHFGYSGLERDDYDQYSILNADTWIGPGPGFTSDSTEAAFNTIRPGTTPRFIYGRLRYERAHNFTDNWQLTFRGVGQTTSDRLLWSEMLGFGGFDSIRGYDQRTVSGDHGWQTSFEVGPRPVQFCVRGEQARARAYVFSDLGQAFIMQPRPGEFSDQFMASAGFGMRMNVGQSLAFRFDYGHNFVRVPGYDMDQRVHIGLIWQFGPLPSATM